MDSPTAENVSPIPQIRGLREVVGTRLEPFLKGFQSSDFQEEIEAFVSIHAREFAVPCPDGSHPLVWTSYHQEYKALFDKRLDVVLDDLDIEKEELLEWMEALKGQAEGLEEDSELPGTDGLVAGHFFDFLKSLTASEDYEHFLRAMYRAAVLKCHEEFGGRLAAPAPDVTSPVPTQEVEVHVPEGFTPGDTLTVEFLGNMCRFVVPEGHFPGSSFQATVQVMTPWGHSTEVGDTYEDAEN